MKKSLLLVLATICLGGGISNAQIVYYEDFETLNTGQGISAQQPAWWTTWTNNPGSAEDPLVVENTFNASQSLYVTTGNDVVLTVGNLNSDRYKMSFYIRIPQNKQAFYSPMQAFVSGGTSHNGMQVFFDINGTGTVDGCGSEGIAEFTYLQDEWILVEQYFDFENDNTDLFIGGQAILSGQWSLGINYVENVLSGFDIYAWGDNPEFYLDSIKFEQVPAPGLPPQNFAAALQGSLDVNLTWEEPPVGSPLSYFIFRDGHEIVEIAGVNSYLDEHLYPGIYEYTMKAYYGPETGYSTVTEPVVVTVPGSSQRQMVLLEIFTGTTCTSAGTIATALRLMANLNLDVAIINYQQGLYEHSALNTRESFYESFYDNDASGSLQCPTSVVNGMDGLEGVTGTTVAHQRSYYVNHINEYLEIPAIYTITPDIQLVSTAPYTFDLSITVEELIDYYQGEVRLFAVLTESNIPETWQGQTDVDYVLREMLPDANGSLLNFDDKSPDTKNFELVVSNSYQIENCELILFVQNIENAFVMEAYRISLADFIGVEPDVYNSTRLYPNPARSQVLVISNFSINEVVVSDVSGKILEGFCPESNYFTMNVEDYEAGIYLIQIETNNGSITKKLIIE